MGKGESSPENSATRLTVAIEAHGERVVPWRQSQRGGSREDRMLIEVTVRLPPKISDHAPELPPFVANQADQALTAITRLDSSHGEDLASLSVLLLRVESVASSKIEHVEASMEDFARAAHGTKSNASATSMVASADALHSLIASVDGHGLITLDKILSAHRILMADDASEATYAGRLRDMQNWIGGSDYAPRNALYVPPPAETVVGYMDDLLEFANRDDVPVLAQAAITHAQFESIHPFTDGNGRIGRALINTILRRRGVTSSVVVPLASALVVRKDAYFEVLAAYREGDAGPIIRAFARAALTAARESETTAVRLTELPEQWVRAYAEGFSRPPRAGSAARKILNQLPAVPFFTAEEMEERTGGASSSVYGAIEKLSEVGILRPLTSRKRRQVWCAAAIIDELEDLGVRIASQTISDPVWREIQTQVIAGLVRQDAIRLGDITRVLVSAEATEAMQAAIAATRLPADVRAKLVDSIRIPDVVRANLDKLGISAAMRDVIAAIRLPDSAPEELARRTHVSDSLQRSMEQWARLSESLVRSTRLPESVISALNNLPARGSGTVLGDTARRVTKYAEQAEFSAAEGLSVEGESED